jgi:hypothetical protein
MKMNVSGIKKGWFVETKNGDMGRVVDICINTIWIDNNVNINKYSLQDVVEVYKN